ncbi:hypothetical protein Tco_1571493 [Tanacetum coccineum]
MLRDVATCLRKLDSMKSNTVGQSVQPKCAFMGPTNVVTLVVGNLGQTSIGYTALNAETSVRNMRLVSYINVVTSKPTSKMNKANFWSLESDVINVDDDVIIQKESKNEKDEIGSLETRSNNVSLSRDLERESYLKNSCKEGLKQWYREYDLAHLKLVFEFSIYNVWKSVQYGVSNGLDTVYWGFLGVGTTFDIFQNIILILYLEYGVLSPLDTGVNALFKSFCGLLSIYSSCYLFRNPFSSTTMGDENPIRTLGDYSKPSHEGYWNTIKLPVGNNVVPLRSDTIRTAKLCNDILMFQQHHEESLSKAWTRFKDLLQKVPHHGIDLWLQVQIFYDHVNPVTRRTIDQSASGKLRDLNAKESWALLEDLALYDNESWNDPRDFAKPVKAIALPQDVPSTSDRRLIELENQVQRLMEAHLAPTQPTQVNKVTTSCEICSGPHDTQYCMEDPEQAFVEYASSRTDEAGEGLVSDFMASQDARLSKFEADFKQQQSEMTNKIDTVLKAITNRIAGALPSDMMSARDKARLGYGDQMNKGVLSYENAVFQSVFVSRTSETEDSPVNDRYAEGMHTQSKPSESDARSSDFNSCESNCSEETHESMPEPVVNEPKVVSEPKVWFDAPIIEEYESDSEDEHSPKPDKKDCSGLMSKKLGLGFGYTKKACFVCGSFSHLIRDCDFHEKRIAKQAELNNRICKKSSQREVRPVWNNVKRMNHQNQFVPKAVLTRAGNIPVNTARASGTNNDYPQRALQNKWIVDSGCSRHVTGNKVYLAEYQDFNGGPVCV